MVTWVFRSTWIVTKATYSVFVRVDYLKKFTLFTGFVILFWMGGKRLRSNHGCRARRLRWTRVRRRVERVSPATVDVSPPSPYPRLSVRDSQNSLEKGTGPTKLLPTIPVSDSLPTPGSSLPSSCLRAPTFNLLQRIR